VEAEFLDSYSVQFTVLAQFLNGHGFLGSVYMFLLCGNRWLSLIEVTVNYGEFNLLLHSTITNT
jgi:hypothetical protein